MVVFLEEEEVLLVEVFLGFEGLVEGLYEAHLPELVEVELD